MAAKEPTLAITSLSHKLAPFVLGLALLAVVACGGGGGAEESPSPSPTASPSPSPTPSPVPSPSPNPLGAPAIEGTRAASHVTALATQIGIRAAGTPGERRGAEYIRDQLASYGYQTTLQDVPLGGVAAPIATLTTNGSPAALGADALSGSGLGTAEAPLVPAGLGRPGDFPADTSGRIALVERGEITFTEKVQNARAAGAKAIIIYNNEAGGFSGEITASDIPAASISQDGGQALTNAGAITVSLTVANSGSNSANVVAKPPTGKCTVLVGGHLDSVPAGPGANDNASGTAVVIEMARAMAADGVLSDVCFVLFGAEEIGLVGSFHYVDTLTLEERQGMRAMLNFDMLGVGTGWPLGGSTDLVNLAGEVAEANGLPYTIESLPEGVGSDHAAFQIAGIPAMIFNCFCDPNYHTAQDLAEFVKTERLAQAGALGMGIVDRLLAGA